MQKLYIDESGSLTNHSEEYRQPFFIISIVKVNDEKVLKRNLKRFIAKNLKILRKLEKSDRMFSNGEFIELKGSALNGALKTTFAKEIGKGGAFELFYIKVYNNRVRDVFLENKARAFNFLLKMFFEHNLRSGKLPDVEYFLQIDERNVKTQSKNTLEEYLNTELILNDNLLSNSLIVRYFDSSNVKFIQVADVFSNLYYSHCMTNKYGEVFEELKQNGILKGVFIFPKNFD